MSQVDVLRPISTRKTGSATVVPSGTLHGVTSDNSDTTYINFATSGNSYWNLRVGSHTPPTNHQRHRIRGRIRIRCDAGTMNEDIDLGRGSVDQVAFETVPVTAVFTEQATAWKQGSGFGLATAGALADLNIGGGWPQSPVGATAMRTAECYVDIDCRERPDYTGKVLDSAGVDRSGGTVTDTNQPSLFFGGVDYDGLPPLNWEVSVADFSASGSGTPPTEVDVTTGLDNGAYVATFTVRSTIRGADPFEHVETVSFNVANIVPPPSPPIMTVEEDSGGYLVSWANPGGQPWDNDYVVAEVWRQDCVGNQRIATIPDGINGSYLDLAIPQLDPITEQVGGICTTHTDACDLTYSVRYWGYVSTSVELPDTIPADLILAWPGTVGTIPSGWTRVTAMDGYYPRGATGVGAPTATGGAANHSHTTPGHQHVIGAHSHSVGGSTGSSNASTTSARFNGATQPQADQPHTHTRPSGTGSRVAQNSGSNNPGTTAADNVPLTRSVIWIESAGSQAQYPVGVLGWATEAVSGWDTDANSSGRFLRGAAAAGNGGANSGTATHTHSVTNHSHAGFSHDHSLGNTSLSNPSSSQEAGYGSTPPRWLPRHTHPMDVTAASTASTGLALGGDTDAVSLEPPNRRLRVLRNVAGGTQTRIIGLYLGTIATLDPLLTLCDGTNGTPDMRTWFSRDAGSDSINSTAGSSTHTHTTPNHDHSMPSHSHTTNVLTSTTGSFEAPSFGDLGSSPTTSHDHSSGSTAAATPGVTVNNSGVTNSVSHIPAYHEAHFVRLDGTISGGPLPVPELKVTDYATTTVQAFTYGDDLDRIATFDEKMAIVTDRAHTFPRLVSDSVPLAGGLHSVSTTLAGEDMTLTIAAEGLPAINALEGLLSADRVYFSPLGGTPGWYAPGSWSVKAPTAGIKVLTVPLARQPWPATPDPEDYL